MALHKIMRTSYSRDKNEANQIKHGLDFVEFHGWDDEPLTFEDDRYDYGETRWIDIGRIEGQLFMLVYTILEDEDENGEELWRLISWRRITEKEALRYERHAP